MVSHVPPRPEAEMLVLDSHGGVYVTLASILRPDEDHRPQKNNELFHEDLKSVNPKP